MFVPNYVPKMLAMLALGFSSGVPFLIIRDVIKAWMTDANVDIATIGLFSAVSIPYTFKFVWSPLMDRFRLPWLGRRRGWMIASQVALLVAIAFLGRLDPAHSLQAMAIVCVVIAFFSASQDIALDAFRREFLNDRELGLGTGLWINAYRLANLATVAIAFALADKITYANVHWVLASLMGIGIITTLLVKEPPTPEGAPKTLKAAIRDPFIEFFSRPSAWTVLTFILLYKIGDNMASAMNIPYILTQGYSKEEYFFIVKGLGMAALFGGMLIGGAILTRMGTARSLWIFGFLQMVSTLGFITLNSSDKSLPLLSTVVVFELFTSGLGATAYSTFMAIQTNKRFTATQFALMTSLMAVPSTFVAASTGFLVKGVGWGGFYLICTLAAIPGILLLGHVAPWRKNKVLNEV